MHIPELAMRPHRWFYALPQRFVIPIGVLALILATYVLIFALPTPMVFSYAGPTCIPSITLLPDFHETSDNSEFKIQPHQHIRLFNTSIASLQTCVIAITAPKVGQSVAHWSPGGTVLAQKSYLIKVAEHPAAEVSTLDRPIPLARPLELPMTTTDTIFSYRIEVDDKQVDCTPERQSLSCDLDALDLKQGQSYEFELVRLFKDDKVATVATKQADILPAVTVTDSSVKPDEVVISKPTSITFAMDKSLNRANEELVKLDGDRTIPIATDRGITASGLEVTFAELERNAHFRLTIDQVEATDGSSLSQPYVLNFSTSGGPKVTGINISHTGVALSATAIIQLDQPLQASQDISKLVTFTGGSATITKRGNQILVKLNELPRCADFSISVKPGLLSQFDIASTSDWSYASRTICQTVSSIGASAGGRSILAYTFGNGASTILYTGAIHGSEGSSKMIMDAWINELEANAKSIPIGRQIVVVPVVNPDGLAARSRNNARNVDLNRNFAVSDWMANITDTFNNPIPNGGGTSPMSEPETQAIANLTSRLKPRLTLSFHAVASVVIANQAADSASLASRYSRLSGYRNATGLSAQTFDYAISGTYDDWIAEKLGLPSILIELSSTTSSEFGRNKSALWEMARL